MRPAIPLPPSSTSSSGRIAATSISDSILSAYAGSTSSGVAVPDVATGASGSSPRAIFLTSLRPEALPTGCAPARTIFMPLYSAGLCEAVTMRPPSSPPSATAK